MRAQSEIARMYTLEVIPYIYNELLTKADLATNPNIKADYQKRLLENSYSFEEVRKIDENHYKRIAELQKRITEETEGM